MTSVVCRERGRRPGPEEAPQLRRSLWGSLWGALWRQPQGRPTCGNTAEPPAPPPAPSKKLEICIRPGAVQKSNSEPKYDSIYIIDAHARINNVDIRIFASMLGIQVAGLIRDSLIRKP